MNKIVLVTAFVITLCISPMVFAQWEYYGLEDRNVYLLRQHDNYIYAGTDSGVYLNDINQNNSNWASIGLQSKTITALLVINADTILAGIEVSYGAVSLYLTTDGGLNWNPYQNGFGGETEFTQVCALTSVVDHPETLYATGEAVVAKSTDFGLSWEEVWGYWEQGGMGTHFIHIDPDVPCNIWAGGESGCFLPYILKSEDYGIDWNTNNIGVGGDNACYCIAIHPYNSDIVYVGMEGLLIKTTDGGDSWDTIYIPTDYPYIMGLAINPENSSIVYMAGFINSPDPQELTLFISEDDGETWNIITGGESGEFNVNDLLLINDGTADILYFATQGGGVYKYTNGAVIIDDDKTNQPDDLSVISKSYPNPFNCQTTISFQLTSPSAVELSIYNVNGQLVDKLMNDHVSAGYHTVTWNAESQSSGVYFYSLKTGYDIETKKILLIK